MAIKVLNQAEFNRKIRASGDKWAHLAKGLIDPDGKKKLDRLVLPTITRSRTGKAIWKAIHSNRKLINIVVWKDWLLNLKMLSTEALGGWALTSTAFANDEPQNGEGTVFWCPYLTYRFRRDENQPFNIEAPMNIVLFHEFGHARQWLEQPEFYSFSAYKSDHPMLKEIRNRGVTDPKVKKIYDGVAKIDWKRFNPKTAKPLLATPTANNPTGKPTDLAYFLALEADNLNRHEWPMCDDFGVGRRKAYADIDCPMATTINAEHKKRYKPKKKTIKIGSKVNCSVCGKPFSKMILRFHEPTCTG